MRIEKKNTGTKQKPRWEPDIAPELDGKFKSVRLVNNEYYEAELTDEEKLRKEFNEKLNARVEEIAAAIEKGGDQKKIADEIRKKK